MLSTISDTETKPSPSKRTKTSLSLRAYYQRYYFSSYQLVDNKLNVLYRELHRFTNLKSTYIITYIINIYKLSNVNILINAFRYDCYFFFIKGHNNI